MPAEPSSHYQLSRLYRELNDDEKALQSIVNTLQLDSYHTGATYQLYLYHQNIGNKEKSQQLFKEFSRLKKAFGKTRKEINADESVLSNPIDSRNGSVAQLNPVGAFEPKFALQKINEGFAVKDFIITDLNRDGFDDIVAIDQQGAIEFYVNDQQGKFSSSSRYQLDGKPEVCLLYTSPSPRDRG